MPPTKRGEQKSARVLMHRKLSPSYFSIDRLSLVIFLFLCLCLHIDNDAVDFHFFLGKT